MAEKDLARFLKKIDQLNQLAESLEENPERLETLSACRDHNEVVRLARSWGFEIGRRWGDFGLETRGSSSPNLFRTSLPNEGTEKKLLIQEGNDWRLELIVSCSFSNEEGFFYRQLENEWILILRGSATLTLDDPYEVLDLSVGNHLHLLPNRPHRVERTDPSPGTLWLTLYWK